MVIKYYTDGACTLNNENGVYSKGPGGWAYARIQDGEIATWSSGGSKKTTNNEQELTAIMEALIDAERVSLPGDEIEIYSDSAYSINIYTQWIKNWEKNGWTRGKKHEPIENLFIIRDTYDLIKEFEEQFIKVTFIKVKGHSTDEFNQYVDARAVEMKIKMSQANA